MMSLETEKRLAELFFETLSGEKRVEEARFTLSQHPDFDISSAFRELDRIGMGSISSNDIKYYLEKQQVVCSAQEAYSIVRQYDINSDGRLSIPEFGKLILPNTLPKPLTHKNFFPRLSLEAEYLLVKLLDIEVNLHRRLEAIRKNIIERPDFNLMEGFRALDKRGYTRVEVSAIWVFLRRNGFACLEMDMQHILNRIDKENDGMISYLEFVDAVLPCEPHNRVKSPSKSIRNSSPLKRPYQTGSSFSRQSPERDSRYLSQTYYNSEPIYNNAYNQSNS